jgi:D-tyrosyl-tRNA(Tyr) deacylase
MIALLQRVSCAQVVVEREPIAAIDAGVLAFVGVQRGDGERQADRLLSIASWAIASLRTQPAV